MIEHTHTWTLCDGRFLGVTLGGVNHENNLKTDRAYATCRQCKREFCIHCDTPMIMEIPPEYPHSCPNCGSRAYIGFQKIDCSNFLCSAIKSDKLPPF